MGELLVQIVFVIAMVTPVMGVINLALYWPLSRKHEPGMPAVSVLIPARNEEARISPVLTSVLASRGVDFEVIVADDSSTDRTAEIVQAFAARDNRLRLVTTPALPAGWMGKNHACFFLAGQARHQHAVFLDADVTLEPDALARIASEFARRPELKLLSGFPRQITGSFWEKLLIPLIHTVLLGYLPFIGVKFTNSAAFATACGQLIAVHLPAYFDVGGHERIKHSVHDGVMLPRFFRAAGHRTDLADITGISATRMYETGPQVFNGLMKNAHEGMATPVGLPVWTVLLLGGHVIPPLLALWAWNAGITGTTLHLAVAAAVLPWLTRFVMALRFRLSWLGALLHPLGVAVLVGLQWVAFVRRRSGHRVQWKDRPVG
jgi:glycosyltransferase involved in cell wall biosynthesis